MVFMICDAPSRKEGKREITFRYDYQNENDVALIKKIEQLLFAEQKRCDNCIHFYREGCFGGYMACSCKIHGSLENLDNPHYDMDGSKCGDYIKAE